MLLPQLCSQVGHSGEVATRSAQAGDQSGRDRVDTRYEDDRDPRGRYLGPQCRIDAGCGNHGDWSTGPAALVRVESSVMGPASETRHST
jgi:hypothetical protein